MGRLKHEFDTYDRNVESLSKFKLELYQQLEDLCKSNTTAESQIEDKNNYEAPIKKPTQTIEFNGSQTQNNSSERSSASSMLPVWRDLENNHTENEDELTDSNWRII